MEKTKFSPIISFLLFTMIYFFASIVLLGSQYRPLSMELIYLRYSLVIFGFSILIFIYFKKNKLTIFQFPSYLSLYLFIIWLLFSLSVALSEVFHHTFPLQGFFFLLVVPFIYFTVMPFITKIGGLVIPQSLFAANILYILISYITKPVQFLPYSGIAANPNGFGQMGALAIISGFFVLITLPKKSKLVKLLIIAAMILSLVSVVLSSSRTSFLIVGIITLIISAHFTFTKRNFKPLLIIFIVGLIGWFSPIKEMLLSGMIEKFYGLYEDRNLFNGRTTIWEGVFQEVALFGHGDNYFQRFIEGAHNSIIYILGVYGVVPAILLTAFLLFLIVLAILYTFQNNHKLALFPFVIIITFTLFSMTESMFGLVGNGITIAFYHIVGLLLFEEGISKETKTAVGEKILPLG